MRRIIASILIVATLSSRFCAFAESDLRVVDSHVLGARGNWQLQLAWTVINEGDVPANYPWSDAIYHSTDEVWDENDSRLDGISINRGGSLAPGESYSQTNSITLPEDAKTTDYLIVKTDAGDSIVESTETNNEQALLLEKNSPDLVVTNVLVQGVSGSRVSLRWTVTNQGSVPASYPWSEAIYHSTDEVWDADDQLLNGIGISRSGSLAPGESYSQTNSATLPEGAKATDYLIVKTDSGDTIVESTETNNEQALLLEKNSPDLVVTNVLVQGVSGSRVSLRWTVTNQGSVPASYPWSEAIYHSADEVLDADDQLLNGIGISRSGSLAPGESYSQTNSATLPEGAKATDYLIVKTDSGDTIVESTETNNLWAIRLSQAEPRLTIAAISIRQLPVRYAEVIWTVRNDSDFEVQPSWSDEVFHSTDDQWQDFDPSFLRVSTWPSDTLSPRASYTLSTIIRLGEEVEAGDHIFVVAGREALFWSPKGSENIRDVVIQFPLQLTEPAKVIMEESFANNLAFSPDGVHLAASVRSILDALYRDVSIYDSQSARILGPFTNHTSGIDSVSFSPRGDLVLTGSQDRTARLWDASTRKELWRISTTRSGQPSPANFSSDGSRVIAATGLNEASVVDAVSSEVIAVLKGHRDAVRAVALSADGSLALTGSADHSALLWDTATSQIVYRLDGHGDEVRAVAFSPDGKRVLTASDDSTVRIWEVDSGNETMRLSHYYPVGEAFFTADGKHLVSNAAAQGFSAGLEAYLWDLDTGSLLRAFLHPAGFVRDVAVAISPNQQWIATAYVDGLIRFWPTGLPMVETRKVSELEVRKPLHLNLRPHQIHYLRLVPQDHRPLLISIGTTSNLVPGSAIAKTSNRFGQLRFGNGPEMPSAKAENLDNSAPEEFSQAVRVATRKGTLPSLFEPDLAAESSLDRLPIRIAIAPIRGEAQYLAIYSPFLAKGELRLSVSADYEDFSLASVEPGSGGNKGSVTVRFKGTGLTSDTVARLVNQTANGVIGQLLLQSGSTDQFVTFDLRGVEQGAYTVILERAGYDSASIVDGFVVSNGQGPRLETHISAPQAVRPGRDYVLNLEYANVGDSDLAAPLFILSANVPGIDPNLRIIDGRFVHSLSGVQPLRQKVAELQVLGLNQSGPPGVLPPGGQFTIPVRFSANESVSQMTFSLEILRADSTPIDWADLETKLRPPAMDRALWTAVFKNFRASIGGTWADYLRALGAQANVLAQSGSTALKHGELLATAVARASGTQFHRTLAARLDAIAPVPGIPLAFSRIALSDLEQRFTVGPLGRGWSHNFDFYLSQPDPTNAIIRGLGGGVRAFTKGTDGSWIPARGDSGSLTFSESRFALREQIGSLVQFDVDGKPALIEDQHQNRIALDYTDGLLTSLAHSCGTSFGLQYDASGRLIKLIGLGGQVTEYQYDTTGELLTGVVAPGEVVERYEYETAPGEASNYALKSITYADGTHQFFAYDERGRLAEQWRDGGAERLQFSYDSIGNLLLTDAHGAVTSVRLGDRGQPLAVRNALGHERSFQYDGGFNVTHITAPNGAVSMLEYDSQGNSTRMVNPLGAAITFEYSSHGRLEKLTDARNNSTSFSYDSAGSLSAITYPDGSQEVFGHDLQGDLTILRNRRGQTLMLTRNAVGQITRKSYSDGRTIDFIYDSRGNLTRANDSAHGDSALEYDARNRLTSILYPDGKGFGFEYNEAGRRTRRIGHDGYILNYQYDAAGRLERVISNAGEEMVRYNYEASGRVIREEKGNGTWTTYAYDAAGQLAKLDNFATDGGLQSSFTYTYDENGIRTSATTVGGTTHYVYDQAGQLIKVTYPEDRVVAYNYDSAGNRTSVTNQDSITEYTVNDLNQYTHAGGTTFSYDADGNLVEKNDVSGKATYLYDLENRLLRVVSPTDGTWEFSYDAFGNRVNVTHDDQTSYYLHDPVGYGEVAAEYDGRGSLLTRYHHGLGLAARVDTAGPAYYSYDGLGHTRELTDSEGKLLNQYNYDPFGILSYKEEAVANPFQYRGRFGAMAGHESTYYMHGPYYAATEGGFLSEDPLRFPGDIANIRTYSHNNPVLQNPRPRLSEIHNPTPSGLGPGYKYDGQSNYGSDYGNPWTIVGGTLIGVGVGLAIVSAEIWLPPLLAAGYAFGDWLVMSWMVNVAAQITWSFLDQMPISLPSAVLPPFIELIASNFKTLVEWEIQAVADVRDFVDSAVSILVRPIDPNDKLAPLGLGPMRAVAPTDRLDYMVRFENDPKLGANAPVQELVVVDYLDANLDWSSVRFGVLNYGDRLISIPEEALEFFTRDVPPTNSISIVGSSQGALAVDVSVSFNPQTGRLEWRAKAVDTHTELFPVDALAGFLPHLSEVGRNGYVTFSVRPKLNTPPATVITNIASIVFDSNEPIQTPVVWNTIKPELNVKSSSQGILLTWSASDSYELVSKTGLSSAEPWQAVPGPFIEGNGLRTLTLPVAHQPTFFALRER